MTTTDDDVIDALNLLDKRKAQMPTRCPRWCVSNHVQAIDEGNSVEDSRKHLSGDYAGGHLDSVTYRVEMERDAPYPHNWGPTVITVELSEHTVDDDGRARYKQTHLTLSTSQARSMAAYLLHLADEGELHP